MRKIHAVAAVAAVSALLAGCQPAKPNTTEQNARRVEENQARLQQAQPAPHIQVSAERANLIRRLERLNSENMSGWVYLISYGTVVASYPVAGKVTSLNAYLMAGERPYGCKAGEPGDCNAGRMIEQPDYDGAYGKNDDGIFFFTADTDTYVEWKGEYVYTDAPLNITIQPRLERQVK